MRHVLMLLLALSACGPAPEYGQCDCACGIDAVHPYGQCEQIDPVRLPDGGLECVSVCRSRPVEPGSAR